MAHNPFRYLQPVDPAHFVGRWSLVHHLAGDLTLDDGDSWAIIAGRRCGKSSLLLATAHQLRQATTTQTGDWLVLPLRFDFKAASFGSVGAFFARILAELRSRIDVAARRRPQDAWPTSVPLDAAWFHELAQAATLTARDFADAVGYALEQLDTTRQPVRLLLLLDEMDETLGEPWTEELYDQLRWLTTFSNEKARLRLLITGSRRFLEQVSSRGSPLFNVLKLHYLTVFDRSGFDQLTSRWPDLPTPVAEAVWQESAGHPFLAQYLLHHTWQQQDTHRADPGLIAQLVQRFHAEQYQDLQGWVNGVEEIGLRVYHVLGQAQNWLTEEQITAQVSKPALEVKRGLTALCYHGLAVHEHWQRYRRTGDLFRTWFATYFQDKFAPPTPLPPTLAAGRQRVSLTYQNFDLRIERSNVTHRVRVQHSPQGETDWQPFTLPFGRTELEPFLRQSGRNSRNLRPIAPDTTPSKPLLTPQTFGEALFCTIFQGDVLTRLRECLAALDRSREGLRLRLHLSDAADLSELPWEYLYDPEHRRFWGHWRHTPIVRYLSLSLPGGRLPVQSPLRILVVIANPLNTPQLEVGAEWQKIEGTLAALVQSGRVTLASLTNAGYAALQDYLRDNEVHVLHFIGHGWFDDNCQEGGLIFCNDNGADLVAATTLGALLQNYPALRLAFLNACDGARAAEHDSAIGTAQTLVRLGLPAVIAMQFTISDHVAVPLAQEFYEALATGLPVEGALTEARIAAFAHGRHLETQEEWGTPVLFMRTTDGHLFDG